ncbi:uncharacterized protein METZ01_LOCUS345504 [marine metagenome]|uniref:Uncharacterized protein n=1 Tax=marine metagenome TaxID=408172 RepID=A0A382R5X5_9ZZZZ
MTLPTHYAHIIEALLRHAITGAVNRLLGSTSH